MVALITKRVKRFLFTQVPRETVRKGFGGVCDVALRATGTAPFRLILAPVYRPIHHRSVAPYPFSDSFYAKFVNKGKKEGRSIRRWPAFLRACLLRTRVRGDLVGSTA